LNNALIEAYDPSGFLLKVAVDTLGERAHAVTAVSVTMARSEVREAASLARQLGIGDRHHIVESHELEVPGFADNPAHRCALCKTELMTVAQRIATALGDAPIILGTNVGALLTCPTGPTGPPAHRP
jgi:uncharacterized protein